MNSYDAGLLINFSISHIPVTNASIQMNTVTKCIVKQCIISTKLSSVFILVLRYLLVMKLQGYVVILIVSLLVEIFNYSQKRYVSNFETLDGRITTLCVQGIMYLSYPLLGHLADVYLTRYRALKVSLVTISGSQLILTFLILINFCVRLYGSRVLEYQASLAIVIPGCLTIIGIGLFEANVIQFGLDQLLEASTPELIKFIHWYYWSRSVGSLLLFYISTSAVCASEICYKEQYEFYEIFKNSIYIVCFIIACTVAISNLILFIVNQKHFYIQLVLIHSRTSTKCSSTLGSTRSLSVAVPSPTGRRIFHAVLTWERTSMEDHSPMRRWRTPRHLYASYHSSCVCLDII